jgi:excisionase family DNA binding protein
MSQLPLRTVGEGKPGMRSKVAPQPHGLTRADLMTAREVAELFGVPISTVYEWGRCGVLPRVKLGRHVRFLRAQVERVIIAAGHATRPD